MHHLIASYLFQYKSCPLPGLGTLLIQNGTATSDFLNKIYKAPAPTIVYENNETDASSLIDYIVEKTQCTVNQAIENLSRFCNNLKGTTILNQPATLYAVGDFFTDESGKILFKPKDLPGVFLPPVKAERVIHPQAEHNILVGDKETTNTVMNEYYSETAIVKDRWWIWAIVLGIIGLVTILIYFSNTNLSSMAGNAMHVN